MAIVAIVAGSRARARTSVVVHWPDSELVAASVDSGVVARDVEIHRSDF